MDRIDIGPRMKRINGQYPLPKVRPRVSTRLGWTVITSEDGTGGFIIPGTPEEEIQVIDGLPPSLYFDDVRRNMLNARGWNELV